MSPSNRMESGPAGRCTVKVLSLLSPLRRAAKAATQAPVPQAWVAMPGRSQTLRRIVAASTISATPTLTPSGNSGSFWTGAASRARSTSARRSTKKTACGLPIHRPAPWRSGPLATGRSNMSTSRASGKSRQFHPIGPSSTLTSIGPVRRHFSNPPAVSRTSASAPVSSMSRCATQRVALPQAETSRPSMLKMRIAAGAPASAPAGEGGSMVSN